MYASATTNLSYSIERMSAHDEILLKSFINILSFKLHHKWIYTPSQANLCIIGDQNNTLDVESLPLDLAPSTLIIAHNLHSQIPTVLFPIKVHELEVQLNQLGHYLQDLLKIDNLRPEKSKFGAPSGLFLNTLARSAHSAFAPSTMALVDTPPTKIDVIPHIIAFPPEFEQATVKLKRWPLLALLDSRQRMKIATILLANYTPVTELPERADCSVQDCVLFLQALAKADLLHVSMAANAAVLGSFTAPSAAQVPIPESPIPTEIVLAASTEASKTQKRSLISRIRSRFGLT